MALVKKSKLRKDFDISPEDLKAVKNFLQGAVYCWVKNRKDEFFAARDLMGGDNFNWRGTPLYCLYKKHIGKGKTKEAAIDEAGKDLGWVLKSVLAEDKRTFESCDKGLAKGYKWVV
ncbi:MAG: hypothetical protein HFP81_00255 [Methylococcales symbiont of Hymedesmia sp. n. MRB-2018]|nr:MAG: hypothetical protein HFP81_00255 [Methylococcales symbiont of Hymedesmia sp. n. MRB-2018]